MLLHEVIVVAASLASLARLGRADAAIAKARRVATVIRMLNFEGRSYGSIEIVVFERSKMQCC